jgi:hypothetical protein
MKKITIIMLLALPILSQAQKKGERIEAAKIGLITNRINLTTEQSQQFWTIYNEFEGKKKELRRDVKFSLEDASSFTATDEKILQAIKDAQNAREKEVNLEREYLPKFLKVISVRQYAELLRTERNFNQILLKQLNNMQNGEKN